MAPLPPRRAGPQPRRPRGHGARDAPRARMRTASHGPPTRHGRRRGQLAGSSPSSAVTRRPTRAAAHGRGLRRRVGPDQSRSRSRTPRSARPCTGPAASTRPRGIPRGLSDARAHAGPRASDAGPHAAEPLRPVRAARRPGRGARLRGSRGGRARRRGDRRTIRTASRRASGSPSSTPPPGERREFSLRLSIRAFRRSSVGQTTPSGPRT